MPIVNSLASNTYMRSTVRTLQIDLDDLQRRYSSGRKADNFSQLDKSSARTIISVRNEISRLDGYTSTIDELNQRSARVDLALDNMTELAKDVYTQALKLRNGGVTQAQLKDAAREAFASCISQLNATVNGCHVFAGDKPDTPPVGMPDDTTLTGTISTAISAIPVPGAPPYDTYAQAVFDAAYGDINTVGPAAWYDGGAKAASVYISEHRQLAPQVTADQQAIKDLLGSLGAIAFGKEGAGGVASGEPYLLFIEKAGEKLSTALSGVTSMAASNGIMQSVLEDEKASLTKQKLTLSELLYGYEAADPYETLSRINELKTTLEGSYRVTAELRGLSLANYL